MRLAAAIFVSFLVMYSGKGADLLFPASPTPVPLRVEVTAATGLPEAAWSGFLDALVAYFDRDGDGSLSATEAKRVFPLPLPGGGEAKMDFATLDADRDGKGTPAEAKAFYRARGFTPLVVLVEPAPRQTLALGHALFHHLDRDADGKLNANEIQQASKLLRRLDDDEDEILTAAEVLSFELPANPQAAAGLKLAAMSDPKAALLRIPLADGHPSFVGAAKPFALDGNRLSVPDGMCVIERSTVDPAARFRSAAAFYLAQFQAVGEDAVAKSVFEDDATARVLVSFFDWADRDGNGKLTRAELEAFFALVERGVTCRAVVTAIDRGRSPFDLLDANGDLRLDLGELLGASRVLPAEHPLSRDAIPASYRLVVGRGPLGDSFGPVPFGAAAGPKPVVIRPVATGPRWFRSADRTGDGFVSAAEFLGPPAAFRELDTNGDGRISAAEAEGRR